MCVGMCVFLATLDSNSHKAMSLFIGGNKTETSHGKMLWTCRIVSTIAVVKAVQSVIMKHTVCSVL